ncbi:MAG: hypothetical protein WC516_06465 [Patescibacteria group bacterium]
MENKAFKPIKFEDIKNIDFEKIKMELSFKYPFLYDNDDELTEAANKIIEYNLLNLK